MNPSEPVGHLPGLAPVTEPEQMGRPELIREVKRLMANRDGDVGWANQMLRERDEARVALREIRDADPVDMALDPGRAARIARAALGEDRP